MIFVGRLSFWLDLCPNIVKYSVINIKLMFRQKKKEGNFCIYSLLFYFILPLTSECLPLHCCRWHRFVVVFSFVSTINLQLWLWWHQRKGALYFDKIGQAANTKVQNIPIENTSSDHRPHKLENCPIQTGSYNY